MFPRKFFTAILAMILMAGTATAADVFDIDPVHSNVGFSVRHMVISKVKGSFGDYSGTITFDENNLAGSSFDGSIKVASINTNNEKRDGHLISADFFDAEKYPEITFQSNRIEKRGDGYVAIGNFTMHGVTKEITVPFEVNGIVKNSWGKTVMGLEAHLKINRQDYGIVWSETMDGGGLVLGDEIEIELNIEAVKKEG